MLYAAGSAPAGRWVKRWCQTVHAHRTARLDRRRAGTGVRGRVLAVTTAAVALGALHAPAVARAGTFIADLCATPAGTPVGTSGLSESTSGTPPVFGVGHEHSCGASGQAITMHVGPYVHGYADLQGGIYTYSTPAGVTISAYRMPISAYAASCLELTGTPCTGGVGQVFVWHTGELDPEYDFRDLGEGSVAGTVERSGLERVDAVSVGVTCDGFFGPCPGGRVIASTAIPWAQFTLQDQTLPKVEVVESPLAPGSALSGEAEWAFSATDSGSGLYAVGEEVNGQLAGADLLDEGGDCRDLATSGTRVFDSPQPCAPAVSSSASLDTDDLSDGSHHVRLYVEDAAGDRTVFFDATVVTQNGPLVEDAPAVSGVAEVGGALRGEDAVFKARPGDVLGAVSDQWDRCSAPGSCQPIPGATSATYTAAPADVGDELVYTQTARSAVASGAFAGLEHTTTAASIATPPVAEAPGPAPGCPGPCPSTPPAGNGGVGANGGDGASGGNGGNGAGVTVNLGALGPPAPGSAGQLGSASDWRVSLGVSPRRVHRHSTIHLAGRVATSPRPSAGKLVYLEARALQVTWHHRQGRLQATRAYGRWITFMVLRARPDGTFAATYRFRLGGRHVYEFRAVAPAEGRFRNATGQSGIVTVNEQ